MNIRVIVATLCCSVALLAQDPASTRSAGNLLYEDGNIWLVHGKVYKLRASDGATVGSFDAGGDAQFGVAFDGANIWSSADFGNAVMKVRASDGTKLENYKVPFAPLRLAFDGSNIWATNAHDTDHMVTKIRASDGANLGSFDVG